MTRFRLVLVMAAAIAVAWFALSAHQAIDTSRASALIAPGSSPAQLRRAEGLLNGARLLNPDRSVDLLRAQAELDENHAGKARAILERVVASEPDNAVAWEWLARASVNDLREFYLAAFRIEQLVPRFSSQ